MGRKTNIVSNVIYLMSNEPLSDNVSALVDIYIQAVLNYEDANFIQEDVDQNECLKLLGRLVGEMYPHKDMVGEDYFREQFVKAYKLYRSEAGYPVDDDYAHDACPWIEFELYAPKNIVRTIAHTMAQKEWMKDQALNKYMNTTITCACGHESKRRDVTIITEDGQKKEICAACYALRKEQTNG